MTLSVFPSPQPVCARRGWREGGMNKALKFLQSVSARPLHGFWAASPCRTCASSYQRCSNSCAATPTLTPTLSRPAGRERGANNPCWTCASSYRLCSNSCAATPTLTPNPSPAPPGGKGGPTALCGRVLEVDEFNVSRQPSKRPSTAGWGRVFKRVVFTLLSQPSK